MLAGATLGMCLLCLSRLVLLGERKQLSMIIAAILLLFTWLSLGNTVMLAGDAFEKIYIASVPTAFFAMLPLIYFYQQLLVGNQIDWQTKTLLIHGLPTAFAVLLSLLILIMPMAEFDAMFFGEGHGSAWLVVNALFFGVLFVAWVVISIAYIVNMIWVNKTYQQNLSEAFSNFSGKTLHWFAWFVVLVCFTWLYSLVALLAEESLARYYIHSSGVGFLVLLIVWFFSLNSIQQKPVFSVGQMQAANKVAGQIVEPVAPIEPSDGDESITKSRYVNSALGDERLDRIARKITEAVSGQQLYLNPDLTAAQLATHLGISAHYLSQAFTQQLGTNFYGYVNTCRIAAAKQQLQASDDTVLDIALRVGFNSRSAFYNAFKKEVGVTPSAYRKNDGYT